MLSDPLVSREYKHSLRERAEYLLSYTHSIEVYNAYPWPALSQIWFICNTVYVTGLTPSSGAWPS